MKVFIIFILKSMTEKKGRFFLLIFSIMISTALFVFSLGAADVYGNGIEENLKKVYEGRNIGLISNSNDSFFSEKEFDTSKLTDIEGMIAAGGVINKNDKVTKVNIYGRKNYKNDDIIDGQIFDESSEAICYISERTAKEQDLKLNSDLNIFINGKKEVLSVKAICAPNGTFYGDTSEEFNVVVPYEYLNKYFKSNGEYNFIAAKIDENDDIDDFVKEFNNNNATVKASSLYDISNYKNQSSTIITIIYVMFAIVCVICCIIIYGAFKLIINERLTVIGTFMSQGATKNKILRIILFESFLYSIFGGIIGALVGVEMLHALSIVVSPLKEYGIYMDFSINPYLIAFGFVFAIFISFISAYFPARTIKKFPVKDVILNRMEIKTKRGIVKFIFGVIFIIIAVLGVLVDDDAVTDYSLLFTAAAFIGIILVLHSLINCISSILLKVLKKNSTLFIALNNVKTSNLLRGNAVLLVIAFTAVTLIATIGKSATMEVVEFYDKLYYDYQISNIPESNTNISNTDSLLEKMNEIESIDNDSVMPMYSYYGKSDDTQIYIEGADPLKYADFNGYLDLKSDEYFTYFEKLEQSNDNSVVISEHVAKTKSKKIGDYIEIDYNGKKATFTILGIIKGKTYNGGNLAIMKPEIAKRNFNIKEASKIYFKVNSDKEYAEKDFKQCISEYGATYISKEKKMEENRKQDDMIVNIISIFGFISMIVASIGVFNNIAIAFNQRKREFAVLASLGANRKKRRNIVLSENIYCGLLSIAIATLFSLFLNKLITKVMIFVNVPCTLYFDWKMYPFYVLGLTLIIFIVSLSTMSKSKKINIIKELKFE